MGIGRDVAERTSAPEHVVGEASPAGDFTEALRLRAEAAPDATAFVFIEGADERTVSYGELDSRARSVAAALEPAREEGTPVLLVYPPGREYVAGLFGCFYAGLPAVPAFPPEPTRLDRTLPRLVSILKDARSRTVLTTSDVAPFVEMWLEGSLDGESPRVIGTDGLDESDAAAADVSADTLALLQYTSGSTSDPRGVMIRHEQLIENSDQIHRILRFGPGAKGVIWVPPYHDLGLIGGILQPVYAGVPSVMLSPIDFLRRPILWLQAVTRHRGTVSGGPNFAYELCVRRIPEEQRKGLDLSSWELAFNGGEPGTLAAIDAFSEAFGPYGFRREAFYCSYGLAEATLLVTGGMKLAGPTALEVDRDALERDGVAVPASPDAPSRLLVGNGPALHDERIEIVDPVSLEPLPEGRVGEIWIAGPNVSPGYWHREEDTAAAFAAMTASGDGPFLRSGDLGFIVDSEVFVTARMKDLIVVNGRNVDPVDIEKACEAAVPGLRRSCGAAFSLRRERRGEQVVVVYETSDPDGDHDSVIDGIRRTVSKEVSMAPAAVVLIRPRTLPKTSSGKAQRWVAREQFLDGELDVVARWPAEDGDGAHAASNDEKGAFTGS